VKVEEKVKVDSPPKKTQDTTAVKPPVTDPLILIKPLPKVYSPYR